LQTAVFYDMSCGSSKKQRRFGGIQNMKLICSSERLALLTGCTRRHPRRYPSIGISIYNIWVGGIHLQAFLMRVSDWQECYTKSRVILCTNSALENSTTDIWNSGYEMCRHRGNPCLTGGSQVLRVLQEAQRLSVTYRRHRGSPCLTGGTEAGA
jgi:hypothetical protein